jgi:hypothetical protein
MPLRDVISRLIGMTKAFGKTRFVTRTWVFCASIRRSANTRNPKSVGSTSMRGLGNSRMIFVIGIAESIEVSRNSLP